MAMAAVSLLIGSNEDKRNSVGSVIDDNLDASRSFEGAHVATFLADDAALQTFVRESDCGGRGLLGLFDGATLNGLGDYLPGFAIGLFPGLDPLGANRRGRSGLHFVGQVLEKLFLGLFRTQIGHHLEPLPVSRSRRGQLFLGGLKHLLPRPEASFEDFEPARFLANIVSVTAQLPNAPRQIFLFRVVCVDLGLDLFLLLRPEPVPEVLLFEKRQMLAALFLRQPSQRSLLCFLFGLHLMVFPQVVTDEETQSPPESQSRKPAQHRRPDRQTLGA